MGNDVMEFNKASLHIYHRFRKLILDSAFYVAKGRLRYTFSKHSNLKERNRERELGL